MGTNVLSAKDIKRDWHLFDAKNQTLGRLSTQIATVLMGKNKPSFVPYLDCGDFVVVTNAAKVKVSGKKATQKKYVRHSGYPGGITEEKFSDYLNRRPEEVLRHAVVGMLPKNRLGRAMVRKLHIYKDAEHPYQKQLNVKEEVSE